MNLLPTLEPFVCGGAAACLATFCIHPVDLAKVRLQLYATIAPECPSKPNTLILMRSMVHKEGFTSVYSGLSAALMRQAVYGTARIGLHRTLSNYLIAQNDGQSISFAWKAASGMISGAVAVCIGTPFDVALVRMQADSMHAIADRRNYKHVFNALLRIAKEEGPKMLYTGLIPNVMRGVAMNVGMMACYDQALEIACKVLDDVSTTPSLSSRLIAAATAGFTASLVSLPFDMIKSRLQDRGLYNGPTDVTTKIIEKEGFFAFWTGFRAYYMRCAPHAMIVLVSLEPITKTYRNLYKSNE